jgi:hypothetical protein
MPRSTPASKAIKRSWPASELIDSVARKELAEGPSGRPATLGRYHLTLDLPCALALCDA